MQVTYLPNFPTNPSNPARVHVPTGKVEINQSVWQFLTPEERAFVLAHEEGHYKLQTFDERQADQYALKQLACKKKNSLWNFITSVRSISKNDPQRVYAAEKSALQVAASKGSSEAKELLRTNYANADGSHNRSRVFILIGISIVVLCLLLIIKNKHFHG